MKPFLDRVLGSPKTSGAAVAGAISCVLMIYRHPDLLADPGAWAALFYAASQVYRLLNAEDKK